MAHYFSFLSGHTSILSLASVLHIPLIWINMRSSVVVTSHYWDIGGERTKSHAQGGLGYFIYRKIPQSFNLICANMLHHTIQLETEINSDMNQCNHVAAVGSALTVSLFTVASLC